MLNRTCLMSNEARGCRREGQDFKAVEHVSDTLDCFSDGFLRQASGAKVRHYIQILKTKKGKGARDRNISGLDGL